MRTIKFSIDYNLPPKERAAHAERELQRLEEQYHKLSEACEKCHGELASIADTVNQELRENGGCPEDADWRAENIKNNIRLLGDRAKGLYR